MTKKMLAATLAAIMMILSCAFNVVAEDEAVYYVEQDASGVGTEDDPFGTIEEAILAIDGKDGTVMIYGSYNISKFKADKWDGMITVKGVNKDSIIVLDQSIGVVFNGDITFKNINFDIGKYAHFNPLGVKCIMDGGKNSNFGYMFHLPNVNNTVVEESYSEFLSGSISSINAGGGYCTSYANGCAGDCTIVIDGATIREIKISADSYMDTMTGISIGGNLNIIINSGTLNKVYYKETTPPDIMGALNFVFNNGILMPDEFSYPDTAAQGVFIVMSEIGGMIKPTSEAGVFEVEAEKGKVAVINGKQVYNGKVKLEPGKTNVTWEEGEQPDETIEIKLVIGKNEIVTDGVAKTLDVPAQIIDSRTMVPLRAIFEALGATVKWDDATKTISSEKLDTTVVLTIGVPVIIVNGNVKQLDVAAQIVESRTLVPARAVAEAYGCEVAWDDATKTVTITK